MRLGISEHARRRMVERGISEERLQRVVEMGRRQTLSRGRWAARTMVDGIDTEVIFVSERDARTGEEVAVVITCYDERSERWRPVVE